VSNLRVLARTRSLYRAEAPLILRDINIGTRYWQVVLALDSVICCLHARSEKGQNAICRTEVGVAAPPSKPEATAVSADLLEPRGRSPTSGRRNCGRFCTPN
jgi:hypothetical protein